MKNITGPKKAAILLLAIGEEYAAEIIKLLDEKEIRHIGYFLSKIHEIDPDELDEVLQEYYRKMNFQEDSLYLKTGNEFIQSTLFKALGADKANLVLENISSGGDTGALESMKFLDSKTISQFISNEHPQTIALILAHLDDPEKASTVLKSLPENIQADVIYRMAILESIPPNVISEINEVLSREMDSAGTFSSAAVGGISAVAEMLNTMEKSYESRILSSIEETNSDLAEQIRELMFTFEDIILIDSQGIQMMLGLCNQKDIVLALKTASDALRDHILSNMSKRQKKLILEDLENMGPVKVSDVDTAQQKIVRIARRLEEEGRIIIASRTGSNVI